MSVWVWMSVCECLCKCKCMWECVCVSVKFVWVFVGVFVSVSVWVCVWVWVYVWMSVCVCECVSCKWECERVSVNESVNVCVCESVWVCVCDYVSVCVCELGWVCVCVCEFRVSEYIRCCCTLSAARKQLTLFCPQMTQNRTSHCVLHCGKTTNAQRSSFPNNCNSVFVLLHVSVATCSHLQKATRLQRAMQFVIHACSEAIALYNVT